MSFIVDITVTMPGSNARMPMKSFREFARFPAFYISSGPSTTANGGLPA